MKKEQKKTEKNQYSNASMRQLLHKISQCHSNTTLPIHYKC